VLRDHRAVQVQQHGVAAVGHRGADAPAMYSKALSSTGPLGQALAATGSTISAPASSASSMKAAIAEPGALVGLVGIGAFQRQFAVTRRSGPAGWARARTCSSRASSGR
jgi:hypothetical protein